MKVLATFIPSSPFQQTRAKAHVGGVHTHRGEAVGARLFAQGLQLVVGGVGFEQGMVDKRRQIDRGAIVPYAGRDRRCGHRHGGGYFLRTPTKEAPGRFALRARFCAWGFGGGQARAQPATGPSKMTVGVGGFTFAYLPLFVAQAADCFRNEGLDVSLVQTGSGVRSIRGVRDVARGPSIVIPGGQTSVRF